LPILNWSSIAAVHRIMARAEANARKARLRAGPGGAAGEETCPPALAEVLARINAYAGVVTEAAIREAVPLPFLDGRPLTEEVIAGLDEFGMGRLMHDLAGLPFEVLGGRGAVLMEMQNRVSEVDRESSGWMGKPWPDWFEDIPACVAEKAFRQAAEEEARRQRLAGQPRRILNLPE
jgi:hypothetical protein